MDNDNFPKTRKEMVAVGGKYYFTGIPCKRGHVVKRDSSGTCYLCGKLAYKERKSPILKELRNRLKPKTTYGAKELRLKVELEQSPSSRNEAIQNGSYYFYSSSPCKNGHVGIRQTYGKKCLQCALVDNLHNGTNKGRSVRRPKRIARTSELTGIYNRLMHSIYSYKRALNKTQSEIVYEIDHIVPLNGFKVCGLHNIYNVQISEKNRNRLKSSKFDPEEFSKGEWGTATRFELITINPNQMSKPGDL